MAPNCPEEVDVFTIPHSRMKELVHKYLSLMTDTNFSDKHHLTTLLENLVDAFQEFRTHEQIENKYIMRKLKQKLQTLSIRSTAVCNCHSDNKLSEMLQLLQDGYRCREKTEVDRINFGLKLRTALEDFTGKFIPHMEEEEKVFQPMLMKYFTFEELRALKDKVISKHQEKSDDIAENQDFICESSDDEEKSVKSEKAAEIQGVNKLPAEVMLEIFSYLNPQELCLCSQVSHRWNTLAMDGSQWKVLRPVQWARGHWTDQDVMDIDAEEDKLTPTFELMMDEMKLDEDADFDESEEYDEDTDDQNDEIRIIQKEAKMLTSMVKYLLPKVGKSVTECQLAYSKGVTSGVLYRILGLCPNLEVLDLTQTRVSDIGFKSLGNNKCGRNLKHVELAGCINITDKTLQQLSFALGRKSCHFDDSQDPHTQEQSSQQEDVKVEKNEIEKSEKCMMSSHKQEVIQGKACKDASVCEYGGNQCDIRKRQTCTKISREMCSNYLDYETVDKTLRDVCDNIKRKLILNQFRDLIDSGSLVSPANKRNILWKNNENLDPYHPDCSQRTNHSQWNQNSRHAWQNCPYFLAETERTLINLATSSVQSDISDVVDLVRTNLSCDESNARPATAENNILPDRTTNSGVNLDKNSDKHFSSRNERGIEYLSLSGCHHVTDQGLRSLVEDGGLPHLKHLDLSGCMKITASGVRSLVSTCPTLDHEFLYYCDNMLDDPFHETASGCQNLECSTRACCRSGN